MNIDEPHSTGYKQMTSDYLIVERAIGYMERNYQRQPSLEEVANSVGFSQYHFQRLFSRWVGISPKRFLQFLTKEHAKHLLERHVTLLDVAIQSGLSPISHRNDSNNRELRSCSRTMGMPSLSSPGFGLFLICRQNRRGYRSLHTCQVLL